jgi:hypothetical protein
MPRKPQSKSKLTDAERHKRFVEMAREIEASEDPQDFDRAFDKVVTPQPDQKTKRRAFRHE